MNLRIIVQRNFIFCVCPKCKKEMTLERVKANNKWEKMFLSFIKVKKYHCKSCKWYGNLFTYTITRNYKRVIINYLILIFIVVFSSVILSLLLKKLFIP
jgi:hypothetical protein